MPATLLCHVEAEPAGFHPLDRRGFSVRLSYACDPGDPHPDARIREFLVAVPHATFAFYWFDGVNANRLAGLDLEALWEPDAGKDSKLREAFEDWLFDYASGPDFLVGGLPALGEATTRDEAALTVTDVISSVSGQPAPLPHRLGLAATLRVSSDSLASSLAAAHAPPEAPLVVCVERYLGFEALQSAPLFAAQVDGGEVEFPEVGGIVCRSTVIRPLERDPSSLVDDDSGFLVAVRNSPDVHRLLERLEQRAGSMFSSFLATMSASSLWDDRPLTGSGAHVAGIRAQRLVWQVLNGLSSALDTAFLALGMPGRADRDGALAGAFLDELESALTAAIDALPADAGAGLSRLAAARRADLRASFRSGLKRHPLLVIRPGDHSADRLRPYLQDLCVACGLTAGAGSSDGLGWILEGIAVRLSPAEWTAFVGAHPQFVSDPEVLVNDVRRELAALQETVTGESGLESCVLRLLGQSHVGAGVVEALVALTIDPASAATRELVGQAYQAALNAFSDKLKSDALDGAQLARQSVGSLVVDLLVDARRIPAAAASDLRVDRLVEKLSGWQFWAHRLGSPAEPPNAGSVPDLLRSACAMAALPCEIVLALPEDRLHVLSAAEAQQQALIDAISAPVRSRFVPDTAPSPLAVRATVDTAVDDLDTFSVVHSGVAMLLRIAQGRWAHVNLAEVAVAPTASPTLATLADKTIVPIPPTVMDNRRQLFLRYDGIPFASRAYSDSIPGAVPDTPGRPLQRFDYPSSPSPHAPVPPLAYGTLYEVALYAAGRTGCLPHVLASKLPWVPAETPPGDIPGMPRSGIIEYECFRTTSIGATILRDPQGDPRIGIAVDGVRPVAADHPRWGLTASSDARRVFVDVFRNADGTGAMALPRPGPSGAGQAEAVTVRLSELRLWSPAAGAVLVVEVIDRADAEPAGSASAMPSFRFEIESAAAPRVRTLAMKAVWRDGEYLFSAELQADGVSNKATDVSLAGSPAASSVWLRLRLASDDPSAALTFADPGVPRDGSAAASQPMPPRLLLCGRAGGPWRDPFRRISPRRLDSPRTSFADARRWLANPALRDAWLSPLSRTVQDAVMELLVTADMVRTADRRIAALLERLPDPAVHALELEVQGLDGLRDGIDVLRKDPKLVSRRAYATLPTLGMAIRGALRNANVKDADVVDALRALDPLTVLTWIDECYSVDFSVTCTDDALGWVDSPSPEGSLPWKAMFLNVPEGIVAQCRIRPLVRTELFMTYPAAIEPALLQWATGTVARDQDHFTRFEGADLQIEAMLWQDEASAVAGMEDWDVLAGRIVVHRAAGNARAYTLSAESSVSDWQWRRLGWVDVDTQRWRYTGRPLQQWLDPRDHAPRSARPALDAGCASFEAEVAGPLVGFIDEAFDNRSEGDSQTQSAILAPYPSATAVAEVVWEPASATLFRHRLTLRSRYEGAMRRAGDGRRVAFRRAADGSSAASWRTVVMLAQRGRIELGRPQLRTLMPLTSSSLSSAADSSPPLLAILQDRPFDRGGLAERTAAEIRIGTGFELTSRLQPLDLRKEVGPDPRLSYRALSSSEASTLVLTPQGPIGLTFDDLQGGGQAFPNGALMLHPRRLVAWDREGPAFRAVRMEESFFGVALRRYLDRRWLVAEPPVDGIPAFDGAWWTTCTIGDADSAYRLLEVASEQGRRSLLRCIRDADAGTMSLWLPTHLVDSSVPMPEDSAPVAPPGWLALASLPATSPTVELHLMHVPGSGRTASLCVFVRAREGDELGRGDELIASVEWSGSESLGAVRLESGAHDDGWSPVNASAATATHWARTGRNTESIVGTRVDADRKPVSRIVAVAQIRARCDDVSLELGRSGEAARLWPRSEQSTTRHPTATQRHIVALLSDRLGGIGRKTERLTHARLFCGDRLPLGDSSSFRSSRPERLRLLEIEVPSRPVVCDAGSGSFPAEYHHAYHDLVAIGFDPGRAEGPGRVHLSFHIRLVGSDSALAQLGALTVSVGSGVDGQDVSVRMEPGATRAGRATHAVELDLSLDNGRAVMPKEWRWILADGAVLTGKSVPSAPLPAGERPLIRALQVRLQDAAFDGSPQELWGESALLVSKVPPDVPDQPRFGGKVDFDWFFGSDAGDPEDAVSEAGLRQMNEAQARLIAMSPFIEVAPSSIRN